MTRICMGQSEGASRRGPDRATQKFVATALVTAAIGFSATGAAAGVSHGNVPENAGVEATPTAAQQSVAVSASASSPRVVRAVRALRVAANRVANGRPFDLETERYRGQPVWEIKVASGKQRPYEFYVSANGRKVVRTTRAVTLGDDARKVLSAKVSLARALQTAEKRAHGRLSEAEIDRTRAGATTWEVSFDRSGDRETKVIVNANTGKVIATATG